MAKASASWLVIDLERRRPIPCGDYVKQMQPLGHLRSLHGYADKVDEIPSGAARTQLKVGRSDIDINGHVNNVKYLEWFFNQMDSSESLMNRPMEVEVNFLGESFQGDQLEVATYFDEQTETWFHSLSELGTNREICRARMTINAA